MSWRRDSPCLRPLVPRVVEQGVVSPVVGDENAVLVGGVEELVVIRGAAASLPRRGRDIMTQSLEQGAYFTGNVLIKVEARHEGYAAFSASLASMSSR